MSDFLSTLWTQRYMFTAVTLHIIETSVPIDLAEDLVTDLQSGQIITGC